jgi:hypothetical protein
MNSYLDTSNVDKMKPLLSDIADNCPAFKVWLDGSFDLKAVPKEAIDQMATYSEKATGKTKIAFADLLRLIILTEEQADYIMSKHWTTLIDDFATQFVCKPENKEDKLVQNFNLTMLKFMINCFQTEKGTELMMTENTSMSFITLCNVSF